MNIEALEKAGIDYAKGVERFVGDEELYITVLSAFLTMDLLERAEAAYVAEDNRGLFACAHEMKGASGAASMTALFQASDTLTELLRTGTPARELVETAFARFQKAYIEARDGIRIALAEDAEVGGWSSCRSE